MRKEDILCRRLLSRFIPDYNSVIMNTKEKFLDILDDLYASELKTFKWYLVQDVLDGFPPIPRGRMEGADRLDTVDTMVNYYGFETAVKITVKILKIIHRNDLAERLACLDKREKDVEVPSETLDTNKKDVVDTMVDMLNTFEKPEDKSMIIEKVKKILMLDQIPSYKINSLPRGICFIINNDRFSSETLKDRPGSSVDTELLARVFSWLGFWVVMAENLEAQKMRDTLKLFARLNPNSLDGLRKQSVKEWAGERKKFVDLDGLVQHGDVFVCCVLSHGCSEGVYGSDEKVLPLKELLSFFNGSNCSALKDKPKLFFIEACRTDPDQPTRGTTASTSAQGTEGSAKTRYKRRYDITDDSDMLVAMGSTDKQKSYRGTGTGTWFIQSLCNQLTRGCTRQEDILMILTDVNCEVSDRKDWIHNLSGIQTAKQMPEVTSRLRSRLVLSLPQLSTQHKN